MALAVPPKRSNVIENIVIVRIQLFKKELRKVLLNVCKCKWFEGIFPCSRNNPALYHQSSKILDRKTRIGIGLYE